MFCVIYRVVFVARITSFAACRWFFIRWFWIRVSGECVVGVWFIIKQCDVILDVMIMIMMSCI